MNKHYVIKKVVSFVITIAMIIGIVPMANVIKPEMEISEKTYLAPTKLVMPTII